MSDEEYFRSCVAKERQLARLLGHHNLEELYESAGTLWEGTQALPKWTRDWTACGPLLSRFEISVSFHHDSPHGASGTVIAGKVAVHISDHPSRERAVMFAVVKAVIGMLEHGARAHP